MYDQGSQECLNNAGRLFEDATILLQNKSFGTAQSLTVTALEEAAKAMILELANLNYVGKKVVKQSMYRHRHKKLILLALEKGLLFIGQIDRRRTRPLIDKGIMNKFENELKAEYQDLENKRLNGFYVQVNINSGLIVNSPNSIKRPETERFVKEAGFILELSKSLCEFFRDYRDTPKGNMRNNLMVIKDSLGNFSSMYDEA